MRPLSGPDKPTILVFESTSVTIRDLAVGASAGPGVLVQGAKEPNARDIRLLRLTVEAAKRGGIEIATGVGVEVRDCRVKMADKCSNSPAVVVRAEDVVIEDNELVVGVRARRRLGERPRWAGCSSTGRCRDVVVRGNVIRGGIGNGITLGSVQLVDPRRL